MTRNILQSSLISAGFSIIFQILCRALTFGINAFIVRSIGREVLGIMNVRLLLLESTLLFLSREAINRAALSCTTEQMKRCSWAQLVNQIWLTVPICIFLSLPCVYIWTHLLSSVDVVYQEQYHLACYVMALSCIVELCAEVPVFVAQVFCFVKLKVILNTLYILVRSVIFIWIVKNDLSAAIHAFAIAQIVSAIIIFTSHYIFFLIYIRKFKKYQTSRRSSHGDDNIQDYKGVERALFQNMDDFPFNNIGEMIPGMLQNSDPFFNAELQTLTLSFVKQGVLKQILTEGEKYVMSVSPVLSLSEQATYDVVNNLGSLAARFLFRPIEDNCYFYFTQTVMRDVKVEEQEKEKVLQAARVLNTLSLVITSIGMLVFTFGHIYAHTVLLLYGGSDFVADGLPENLLKWHCLAILFLGINGITECYMFATNTSKDIDRYNYLMGFFSVSFLVLSYLLTNILGPVGFIFANCINMLCRICYSTRFIWSQFKPLGVNPLRGMIPGRIFVLTLIPVAVACKYIQYSSSSILGDVMFGGLGLAVCLLSWIVERYDLVKLGIKYVSKSKTK